MAKNVRITNELKNPSSPGRHYRFLCMTGPEKGKSYYLTGKRVVIGRGENADIQIVDVKISREHAELSFVGDGYMITDIGAQNGILVNDTRVKQKKLSDTEKVVIGQTVFKYNIIEVAAMEIIERDEDASLSAERKGKIDKFKSKFTSAKNLDEKFSNKKPTEALKKGKPKFIVITAVLGIVLYVLLGKDDPAPLVKPKNIKPISDFDSAPETKKAGLPDPESVKKLESYMHSGRREFSEGNYFRAMEDFRLALLLTPSNGHASFYLQKAKQRLDEDIEKNFLKGKQEYESRKLQAAIVSYCGVVQLIQNYPNDERFKNAMLKISAIESELGLEKGEIKCFEEKSADPKN